MKGVKAKDLRGNETEELERTLRQLEDDLFKHRMKRVTNQLENTMLIRNTRRDIARVQTVLADKRRAGAVKSASETGAAAKEK